VADSEQVSGPDSAVDIAEVLLDVTLGTTDGPIPFVISADLNEQYLYAQRDYNPLYLASSGSRGIAYPGAVLHAASTGTLRHPKLAEGWTRRVGRDEVEWHAPVYVDEPLEVSCTYVSFAERKGRPWLAREIVIRNAAGELKLIRRAHTAHIRKQAS
jgi:acyl dehydratase